LDDRSLQIEGSFIDRLIWASEIMQTRNFNVIPLKWELHIQQRGEPYIDTLWKEYLEASNRRHETQHHTDEWIAALTGEDPTHSRSCEQWSEAAKSRLDYAAYCRVVRNAVSSDQHKDSNSTSGGNPHEFERDVQGMIHTRRIIYTHGNRTGLGPFLAQPGDVCCICPGVTVPYILRRKANGRYTFIGECYLYGVMRGEMMEQLEQGKLELETIIIE
jgi:hypothetical protein